MVIKLIIFALLILFTAFFVATEFSIIRVRHSRVQQLVQSNIKNSKSLDHVTSNLDAYLSACQLGITITALGLGWLGEPTIAELLRPIFEFLRIPQDTIRVASFIVAFAIVTYLHVVLGELAPKTIAIVNSEKVALFLSPFIIWFHRILYPFIWLLNGSANKLAAWLGYKYVSEHEAHSEEEIKLIINDSYESGKINKSEYGIMNRVFDFDTTLAKDVMVPRTDMVCVFIENTRAENIEIIKNERYTRFPVAEGDKDNIIGLLHTKSYLFLSNDEFNKKTLKEEMQPILTVPDSMPIRKLLALMQQKRMHMAILVDEYGGTSGLITIEDIIEELVGEIRDEFDNDEIPDIEKLGEGHYIIDGRLSIEDVNDLLQIDLVAGEVHTIGGWLYQQKQDIAEQESLNLLNLVFTVKKRDEFRIRLIEIFVDGQVSEMSELGHA